MMIIEIDGERFELNLDGKETLTVDSIQNLNGVENEPETYLFKHGDRSYKINVIEFDLLSRTCTVELNGQVKQVRILRDLDVMIEKMGLNTKNATKQSLMVAPMPGLVTEIKITIGQHVEKGTPLLILEAMKMENVIAAPHDATVKEINVRVGQAVERGFPLLEFL
jgi:biotin carboxyl carrier protein